MYAKRSFSDILLFYLLRRFQLQISKEIYQKENKLSFCKSNLQEIGM